MIECKRRTRILFISLLGFGCSTSTPSDNSGVFTGTYDVVSANGQQLPLLLGSCRCAESVLNNQSCTMTGLRGQMTPTVSGRFTATYTYRRQCGATISDINGAVSGSYTLDGSNLFLSADSGIGKRATHPYLVTAALNGATITAQSTVSPGVDVIVNFRHR